MSSTASQSDAPKRHHYVARSYLDRFANERGQITVYDRRQEREPFAYTTSTQNAAVISGFYNMVDGEGNKDLSAEALLSALEGDAKRVLETVDSGVWDDASLPEGERQILSLYMAIQFTRTPEHRYQKRVLNDLYFRLEIDLTYQKYGIEGITNWLTERYGRKPTEGEVASAVAIAETITDFQVYPNDNQMIMEMFEEAAQVAGILEYRPWKLLRARRDRFLTSDRPVTPWRQRTRETRHLGVGLASADAIYFPIDPRQVIVAENGEVASWSVTPVTEADANRINERVAHWSTRYVYHRPDHRVMNGMSLTPEGPILHINGLPVREGTNVWNTIRRNYIEGTSLPVIHTGFGVDARRR